MLFLLIGNNGYSYSQKEKVNFIARPIGPRDVDASTLSSQEKDKLIDKLNKELLRQDLIIRNLEKEKRHIRNERIILEGDVKKQGYENTSLFEENSIQKTFVSWLVLVLVLAAIVVYLMIRSSRSRQKYLDLLEKEKNQVSIQKELVVVQKEETEKVLIDLTDSIRYALRIQNAVLPNESKIAEIVGKKHFVLFEPKDIVSGDFYYVVQKGDWVIAAVADCTGHGVPGGFLSMLAITLLNDTVLKSEELRANEILNELRLRLVESMEQRGNGRNGQDGLDISLLLINRKKKKGQWAGANTPMIQLHKDNDELKEYKADKRPIGEYPDMRLFTNHEFSITKGDRFYLFSDGYVDQFGGPNDKKFMRKRFKKMLLDTQHLSMLEQHDHFKDAVDTWRSFKPVKTQQVDDITVFGIEL